MTFLSFTRRLWPSLSLSFLLCLGLVVSPFSQAQEPLKPFIKGSLEQILTSHQNRPFVLSFWSLDCRYCNEEFALFNAALSTHKQLHLELVATDHIDNAASIRARLEEAGLAQHLGWAFADSTHKLRFEIDKNWHGELPRTYFFNKDGSVRAQSGKIDEKAFQNWLATNL